MNNGLSKNSCSFYWIQDKKMTIILDFAPLILHGSSLLLNLVDFISQISFNLYIFLVPVLPFYSKSPLPRQLLIQFILNTSQ